MAKNKYISDYRLEERVDSRGRVRKDYVYVGEHFRFCLEPAALRQERRHVLILCAVGVAAFVAALMPASAASHTAYITLPFIFAALPLGIVIETVISAPVGEALLERRQADRLANRYPAASIFILLLSVVSLLGEGVFGLRGGHYVPGDAVFSLCAALLASCGGFLLHKRRSFDTRKA